MHDTKKIFLCSVCTFLNNGWPGKIHLYSGAFSEQTWEFIFKHDKEKNKIHSLMRLSSFICYTLALEDISMLF